MKQRRTLINDTVSWFSVLVGVGATICILLVSSAEALSVRIVTTSPAGRC